MYSSLPGYNLIILITSKEVWLGRIEREDIIAAWALDNIICQHKFSLLLANALQLLLA